MALWSNVDGNVLFSRSNHRCSLREIINELRVAESVKVHKINEEKYLISFNYAMGGDGAVEVLKQFISSVKEFDNRAVVDLNFTTVYRC